MMDQLSEFGKIFVFFILGVVFVLVGYVISYFLSRSKPNPEKLSTYECGEEPQGGSRMQFNNRFYVIALVFLLFDVEIVFLFPWATVFGQEALINQYSGWGWFSFAEMSIFISILLIGLLYLWVKGDLEWVRPEPVIPETDSKVPAELYRKINEEEYTVRTNPLIQPLAGNSVHGVQWKRHVAGQRATAQDPGRTLTKD